jgi:phage FluMu gp28-like protein
MPKALDYFLPYQLKWINAPDPFELGEKSRRIGWTYASSYRAVERRLKLKTNLYFSSADLTAAREFVDYCVTWCRVFNVVAQDLGLQVIDEEDGITAFVLRFPEGQKIVAGSSNPKFFRSKGGDADGDEYAFHKDQRELLKAMHATALVWGHQLRLWSTHNGEDSFFNTLVKSARQYESHLANPLTAATPYTGLKARVQTVTILDAVEQGLVEKIQKRDVIDLGARKAWLEELRSTIPDEDTWNEEYMCRPASDQRSLLTYSLIQQCEAANLEVVAHSGHLTQTGTLYAGFDVGRRHDRSVLWVIEKIGDVYWSRLIKSLHNVNYTAQEEMLSLLMGNPAVKRLCIDATGIGDMLAERLNARFGSRVEPVHFTAPVKSELAMPLLRLFQDKLIRIPASAEVREDLHAVRKIVTAANNVRLDADRDEAGHADRFWALALAYHASDDLKVPLPAPQMRKPAGF